MRVLLGLLMLMLLFFSCSIPEEADVDPPTVALLYPTDGQIITTNIPVSIVAGDNKEVKKVEFYVDGNLVKNWTTGPYTFQWDVTPYMDNKPHYLSAAAYDKSSNIGITPTVEVIIRPPDFQEDNIPPTLQLIYPLDGGSIVNSINMLFIADDDIGVTRVELYHNGVMEQVKTEGPYTFTVDGSSYTPGTSHTFFGIAYDSAGNHTVSNTINLIKEGFEDNIPPVVTILFPIDGSVVDSVVDIFVDAQDENGILTVELLMDGDIIASDNSKPYEFSWDSKSVPYGTSHTFIVKATDVGNNISFSEPVTLVHDSVFSNTIDNEPPTVTILSPVASDSLSGSVTIRTDVTDNFGVDKVEFFIDGELKSTDRNIPYEYTFNANTYPSGSSHSIYIKAFDIYGNIGTAFQTFIVK